MNSEYTLTRALVEARPGPSLVLDSDLRIVVASRSFYEHFQKVKEHTQGQLIYQIGAHQYDVPALKHFLRNVIPERRAMKDYKVAYTSPALGPRVVLLSAREAGYENSQRKFILVVIADITAIESNQNSDGRPKASASVIPKNSKKVREPV